MKTHVCKAAKVLILLSASALVMALSASSASSAQPGTTELFCNDWRFLLGISRTARAVRWMTRSGECSTCRMIGASKGNSIQTILQGSAEAPFPAG